MPAIIGDSTQIWELNVHWQIYSQCGVWDPARRGVDIWECIRDRRFRSRTTDFLRAANNIFCRSLDPCHSATQRAVLEILRSKMIVQRCRPLIRLAALSNFTKICYTCSLLPSLIIVRTRLHFVGFLSHHTLYI